MPKGKATRTVPEMRQRTPIDYNSRRKKLCSLTLEKQTFKLAKYRKIKRIVSVDPGEVNLGISLFNLDRGKYDVMSNVSLRELNEKIKLTKRKRGKVNTPGYMIDEITKTAVTTVGELIQHPESTYFAVENQMAARMKGIQSALTAFAQAKTCLIVKSINPEQVKRHYGPHFQLLAPGAKRGAQYRKNKRDVVPLFVNILSKGKIDEGTFFSDNSVVIKDGKTNLKQTIARLAKPNHNSVDAATIGEFVAELLKMDIAILEREVRNKTMIDLSYDSDVEETED